jgi:hypothetical protein
MAMTNSEEFGEAAGEVEVMSRRPRMLKYLVVPLY